MKVSEAVASRRSIRDFLPRPLEPGVLLRVLERARYAPSGGNLQPWNCEVVVGAALSQLLDKVAGAVPEGRAAQHPEYAIYPGELGGRYAESRFAVGEAMYQALGVGREDKKGRLGQFLRNYRAFGAPALLLIHTPRYMGPPQWADIGMWLQTVMLLLREEGLDSCSQEAWALYQKIIRECIPIPDEHILFCGVSVGYRNPEAPVNQFPQERSNLAEHVRFHGE